MSLNDKTIAFHLLHISRNNRYLAHRAEIEKEISERRLTAYKLANTRAGDIVEKSADDLGNALDKAIQERENI